MSETVLKIKRGLGRQWTELAGLNSHEVVVLLFFIAVAALGIIQPVPASRRMLLMLLPIVLWSACVLERRASTDRSRLFREWCSLSFILPAYWAIGSFAGAHEMPLQEVWVAGDRLLLNQLGAKAAIESLSGVIPFLLELTYLLLYAFPPIAMMVLFGIGARTTVPLFLSILFLGTLTAYLALPVMPVESPRIVFPGVDLPGFSNFPRAVNVWLLDHFDISTSVFPSGHVAVAFSCAFGLQASVPRRKEIWGAAFALAFFVYAATIYGRYHYAVDGLASIGIATVAWRTGLRWAAGKA